jgi:hypothetical protein
MLESHLAKPTPPLLQEYHRKRKILFTQSRAGANSHPASPFRGGAAVPERVVSATFAVGRLWLSFVSLGGRGDSWFFVHLN